MACYCFKLAFMHCIIRGGWQGPLPFKFMLFNRCCSNCHKFMVMTNKQTLIVNLEIFSFVFLLRNATNKESRASSHFKTSEQHMNITEQYLKTYSYRRILSEGITAFNQSLSFMHACMHARKR